MWPLGADLEHNTLRTDMHITVYNEFLLAEFTSAPDPDAPIRRKRFSQNYDP